MKNYSAATQITLNGIQYIPVFKMPAAVLMSTIYFEIFFFFRKMNCWRDRGMIDVQMCDKTHVIKY